MPSPSIHLVANLSDPIARRKLIAQIEQCEGICEVRVHPRGEPHSDEQLKYYHAAVVGAFVNFLNSQDYERYSPRECHRYLRDRFLGRSTTELTVSEFWDYVERVRAWLADAIGLWTEDPRPAILKNDDKILLVEVSDSSNSPLSCRLD